MSGAGGEPKADIRAVAGTHAAPAAPAGGSAARPSPMPGSEPGDHLGLDELLPLAIPSSGRKGPGRPKGAANIRTNKTFEVAVSRYGDPLIASIAMGNMDPRELIRDLRMIASDCGLKLGATVMDVVRFQEQCRASATPYGHGKRIATDHKGDEVLPVFVMGGAAGSTTNVQVNSGRGGSIEDRIEAELKAKQSQSVIDAAADMSHDGKSHDETSD